MFVISDKQAGDRQDWVVGGQPVDFVTPAEFTPATVDAIVVDIDLGNRRLVAHLARQMDGVDPKPTVACVVDPNSYRERAEAYTLGATVFFQKQYELVDLQLFAEQVADCARASEPTNKSIERASRVLDDTFSGLLSDAKLDVDHVRESGDQILSGLELDGMQTWLSVVRARHESTFQHCLIVTGLATNFARYWGMAKADVEKFSTIGLLHDIGKVRVPNEILEKPGKLTDEELQIVRSHPVVGYDYLLGQQGMSEEILNAVRHHHEALDGSGYPDALKGSQINDLTRILTICDIYGALVEQRPYKRPALPEEALAVLLSMADDKKVERALVLAFAKSIDVSPDAALNLAA